MMFDLHAHILPGIDDGAKTPDETLEMSTSGGQVRYEGHSWQPRIART